MISRALDNLIAVFAPAYAVQRMQARATLQQIEAFSNSSGGYNAGKLNRLTKHWDRTPLREIEVPRAQIERLRAESWNLYRNNPYARKIVRTLETKVIGRGLHPQSLATRADGTPHIEFRRAAARLWWSLADCLDIRGRPGRGGCDLVELQKLALRSCILSGDLLTRTVTVSQAKAREAGSPVRLMLHLVDASRLSPDNRSPEFNPANQFYRGIELTPAGERVAYHITTPPLDEQQTDSGEVARVAADSMLHLFVQEDVDQLRGVPWFASALLQFRDTGDLQYNVLKSSAMAACVVLGYRLPAGKRKFGLQSTENGDLTDADGNAITRMAPGMMINLGQDGELKGFSPNQPTHNVEAFIQHLLRGVGSGLPGLKSSTITGDYRNSSFSSERSADNDCWPEMESVQDWFATAWCQPIYELVIRQAVLSGWFSGIVTADEFEDRSREFLDTQWCGPVPRSINPTEDAEAAKKRIANGQTSPQIECAALGRQWQDVLSDNAEWIRACQEQGLPDWYVAQTLGLETAPRTQEGAPADAEQTSETA